MKTRLIFVRHGEATGNVQRRFHGDYDSALTENGMRQAELAACELDRFPIDRIIASDLTRTFETARAIARRRNLEVTTDSKLREINGGEWEDVPWGDLPEKFPESYEHWLHRMDLLQMPGGESAEGFQQRVITAVEKIEDTNAGKSLCIVTHGTVIKVLLCHFKGIGLDKFCDQPWQDNASITLVEKEDGIYRVLLEGFAEHLGEYSTMAKQDWWKK